MKEYYKITEVARLYGLCTDTLRYYEEQGLLHPIAARRATACTASTISVT
jgi:DNA-binding transcriptional MerR regulator